MSQKQALCEMLEHAHQLWVETLPNEEDKKEIPEWDSTVSYGNENGDEPIYTCFDFDREGSLLCTYSFIDPAATYCPGCDEWHVESEGEPLKDEAIPPPEKKTYQN